MRHPTEDELILHHYGESEGTDEIVSHLRTCDACRAAYEAVGRTLVAVEAQEVPERGEEYGAAVWARIAPKLAGREPAGRSTPTRPGVTRGPWRRFLMPAAMAASLVGAFWLGRYWSTGAGGPQPLSGPVRERILIVAVGDHLERSQIVLVELTHAKGDGSVDISAEQRLAQELVDANRLYRQTAVRAGEAGVASVLDDLERVLIDVATGPSTLSSAEFETVRRRIEERGILFKVRVLGSQMREREKESQATSKLVS